MKVLQNRSDEALETADVVKSCLHNGEEAFIYVTRAARRRLSVAGTETKKLTIQQGRFGGYIRLSREGKELYINVPELTAAAVPMLLAAGRAQLSLGSTRKPITTHVLHNDEASGENIWENTTQTIDLESVSADHTPLVAPLYAGLGNGYTIRTLNVSEILSESIYARPGESSGVSRRRGVDLQVMASDDKRDAAVARSRYSAGLGAIDLTALGRELALTIRGFGPATETFRGSEVLFTPFAAAQLLRAVVGTLLLNPLTHQRPLCSALLDDGRAPDGCSSCAFDCEGTPTGAMMLVDRNGVQQATVTRLKLVAGEDAEPAQRLTGHAAWDRLRGRIQLAATNARMEPTGLHGDPYAGDRCVVVDVRTLGVEEHRSSGQLAFRLLAVRAVDGSPAGTYEPLSVEGEPGDFLAAVNAVGETVSYYSGPFSVGGAEFSMNLSGLALKGEN
jgi:PmbA/TldA metallopeptidase C-terminal domain